MACFAGPVAAGVWLAAGTAVARSAPDTITAAVNSRTIPRFLMADPPGLWLVLPTVLFRRAHHAAPGCSTPRTYHAPARPCLTIPGAALHQSLYYQMRMSTGCLTNFRVARGSGYDFAQRLVLPRHSTGRRLSGSRLLPRRGGHAPRRVGADQRGRSEASGGKLESATVTSAAGARFSQPACDEVDRDAGCRWHQHRSRELARADELLSDIGQRVDAQHRHGRPVRVERAGRLTRTHGHGVILRHDHRRSQVVRRSSGAATSPPRVVLRPRSSRPREPSTRRHSPRISRDPCSRSCADDVSAGPCR